MAQLLDQFGRPIQQDLLTEDLASPNAFIRPLWNDPVADNITPDKLARLMLSAKEGDANAYLTLADEMEEREPHYGSVLSTRKLAISGLTPTVDPGGSDAKAKKIAEAVEELVKADHFGDLVDGCAAGIAPGYSVNEIMWDRSGKEWYPEAFECRDPRFFRFNLPESEELRLLSDEDMIRGVPLAPFKFVVHYPRRKMGLKISSGLARLAATSYMCKVYSIRAWMRFMEVYGMPLRIGRYGPGTKEDQKAILKRAVVNLGSDAAAILPKSMSIDFVDAKMQSGGETVFERIAAFWDKQMSKAILGQTMTTEDGSSQSQAEVHNEVRLDILKSDAKAIGRTIGKDLVRAYVDLNFGPQDSYPKVSFPVEDPSDIKAVSEAVSILVPQGLKVSQNWIRKTIGAPKPDDDEEILTAPGETQPTPPKTEKAANREQTSTSDEDDEIDRIIEDDLNDWEPQMNGLLDPVMEALEEAEDFDDFKRRLRDLDGKQDLGPLAEQLAISLFKARGLGDATDRL